MNYLYRNIVWGVLAALFFSVTIYTQSRVGDNKNQKKEVSMDDKIRDSLSVNENKSDEDWCRILTPEQYEVLRQKGTERAYTGKYYKHKEKGTYICSACGSELFMSVTKYDSGSGWPSFWDVVDKEKVRLVKDNSYGMNRVEVLCGQCGGHLGHVFDDGPEPTGLRYCINSVSLNFIPEDSAKIKK